MSSATVHKHYECSGCLGRQPCSGHVMTARFEGASDIFYLQTHDGCSLFLDLPEVGVLEDLLLALRGLRAELAGHVPTTEGVEYE